MEPSRQLGEEEKAGGASVAQHHPKGTFYSQLLHLGKPDSSLLPGGGWSYLDPFPRALLLHTTPSPGISWNLLAEQTSDPMKGVFHTSQMPHQGGVSASQGSPTPLLPLTHSRFTLEPNFRPLPTAPELSFGRTFLPMLKILQGLLGQLPSPQSFKSFQPQQFPNLCSGPVQLEALSYLV